MLAEALFAACATGFVLLVLASAATDIATLTIPNRIPMGLVILFAVAAASGHLDVATLGWHVATGLAMFAVTVGLFVLRLFGGGDAKLLPAVALWVGPSALMPFIFHTALAGGLLSIGMILLRRLPVPEAAAGQPWLARLRQPDTGIPYGIAIAYGGLVAAGTSPLFASLVS